nr:coiled-coil domain-containing protein 9B [Pelodiscus sinensis]XP_014431811.1 coiled-coil domain-containing protein 9B [Pelodiscus sinensis]XP_014431813.1 coiled-coil domain-containing protein 9B [Pelodiscus sinensis]|eukprot:XP_006128718.1 coiled-coil domain-containing protein 9B [Pelodiscus sinensis]
MQRSATTVDDAVLRKKEQKDVELDKKILALRKKNEALIRRYQEIEEDRKRAEQEGMAVTSRRPKQDGLTITITKAHNEKRVVSEKWGSSCPTSPGFGVSSEAEDEEEADHMFTFRMGKRMQLAVTMDNKPKGKRIVSEKRSSDDFLSQGGDLDLSEEEVDHLVAFHKGRRMQIAITMDNKEKGDERRTVERRRSDAESEHNIKEGGKPLQKSSGDLGFTMTGRERSEYVRWKKERDQIDLERLARHKNAKGEWRRAWDVEKSEHMFEEDFTKGGEPVLDNLISKKGGRNARKFQHRSFPSEGRGGGQTTTNTSEPASRTVPVVSSKARGKDRLTGRARRWDAKEGEDMPFLKDDHDNQRSTSTDTLKSKFPAGREMTENCTELQEENMEQQRSQDPGFFSSQGEKGGTVLPAEDNQREKQQAGKCLSKEVEVSSMCDSEPESKLSQEEVLEVNIGKPGTASLSQQGGCMNSSTSQSITTSTAGPDSMGSTSPPPENGLEKKALPEKEHIEDSSESLNGKLEKAACGRCDRAKGLSLRRVEEVTQHSGSEGKKFTMKGDEVATCLEHRGDPASSKKDISDKIGVSQQDGAKAQNRKDDQPEKCSYRNSGDNQNSRRMHWIARD